MKHSISPYIANKNISRNNYYTVLWFVERHEYHGGYPSRREFNIGGIHFQRCSGIMIHCERICPCVLFCEEPSSSLRRAHSTRKKIRGILSFSGSLILTTMAETIRKLTWTRKFPLQRTGNIFQRPAKPLQIHVVYDITASGESFVACPAYHRFANIKKWYNLLIKYFTNIDVKYILLVITTKEPISHQN